ncbi:MAG: hypothetical protein ACOCTG_02855, partial [Bacteroidota bacterium]
MFELIVLLISTTPLIVGLYALRKINERSDDGSDDQPPPPDPDPPLPSLPSTPRGRSRRLWSPSTSDREPVMHVSPRRLTPTRT